MRTPLSDLKAKEYERRRMKAIARKQAFGVLFELLDCVVLSGKIKTGEVVPKGARA